MRIWRRAQTDTMHAYLREYGDVSFLEQAMNDVDSLVFCMLAYLKFDGLVPGVEEDEPPVTLEELAGKPGVEGLFADERFAEDNRELFAELLAGRRFRNLKLNCYVNVVEKERETQFSAVVFLLEDGTVYVAFRGTDETIIGWKEDFNMAFQFPVPGQVLSVEYLNRVTDRFPVPFYVGGHSKGGNLAIYSAMKCAPAAQQRILKIYSMDGPGFKPGVLPVCGYEKVADRVVKYLPHSSLVGMLLEWDTRYHVVASGGFGLTQHNPYHWKIKEGGFVPVEEIYERARLWDGAVNTWILSHDEQQIRLFVNALYQVMSASEAEDLIALKANWRRSIRGIRSALRALDRDTAKVLREAMRELLTLAGAGERERVTKLFSGSRRPVRTKDLAKRKPAALPPTA